VKPGTKVLYLRVPEGTHRELAALARTQGSTLTAVAQAVLAVGLGRRSPSHELELSIERLRAARVES
jgi:hypothetical protein